MTNNTINQVVLENGVAYVSYKTGASKIYRRIPKTVQAFCETAKTVRDESWKDSNGLIHSKTRYR